LLRSVKEGALSLGIGIEGGKLVIYRTID